MDDALIVRGLEGLRDLPRDRQRFVDRDGALPDPVVEGRPLDQLHHQRLGAVGVFQTVDRRDVGVIQGGEHFRFALESRESIGVGSD